jgi:hypothetical protein
MAPLGVSQAQARQTIRNTPQWAPTTNKHDHLDHQIRAHHHIIRIKDINDFII